ncbi:hypothetical protein [Thermofilum pendens]|uniref:hypothetical protein n=1 Tax=Thermofilum pendens TaxID=2269 RepID=UPI0011E556B7|nr:hypothetical protein [Thermofilum pendens]
MQKSRETRVKQALREAREIIRRTLGGQPGGSLEEALRDLYERVPREEWLRRALARYLLGTVERQGSSTWVVRGVPELGDRKPLYIVTFTGDRYECSCYRGAYGWARRRSICTHIGAVMLERRRRRIDDYAYGSQ